MISRTLQLQEVAVDWQELMVLERNATATTHTTTPINHTGLHPVGITRWRRTCEEANIDVLSWCRATN